MRVKMPNGVILEHTDKEILNAYLGMGGTEISENEIIEPQNVETAEPQNVEPKRGRKPKEN